MPGPIHNNDPHATTLRELLENLSDDTTLSVERHEMWDGDTSVVTVDDPLTEGVDGVFVVGYGMQEGTYAVDRFEEGDVRATALGNPGGAQVWFDESEFVYQGALMEPVVLFPETFAEFDFYQGDDYQWAHLTPDNLNVEVSADGTQFEFEANGGHISVDLDPVGGGASMSAGD